MIFGLLKFKFAGLPVVSFIGAVRMTIFLPDGGAYAGARSCETEEITDKGPIVHEWVKALNYITKPLEERDTYGKVFIQICNMWQRSEAVRGSCWPGGSPSWRRS